MLGRNFNCWDWYNVAYRDEKQTKAEGVDSIAFGSGAKALTDRTISIGDLAGTQSTSGSSNIAIGGSGNKSVTSFGAGSEVNGRDNIALGTESGSIVKGIINTAVGAESGNNVRGDNNLAVGPGAGSKVTGDTNAAFGGEAGKDVKGNNNLAMGTRAGNNVTASRTISLGALAKANADDAIVIGTNSSATKINAIAIGKGNTVSGTNSIAVGTGHTIIGNNSGAFGDPNSVSGSGSYAVGNNNTIAANNAFVLGNNVTVTSGLNGAVGIGNNSTVTASTLPSFVPTGVTSVAGIATGSNVVSVGSAGNERRLTNVAAGGADTDAVNVSQLKGLSATVVANKTKYYSVASTAAGAGSNANNDGATKPNAMAMGGNAKASGGQAIAIGSGDSGQNTTASGEQSIAIGANVESSGNSSIAIGGDDLDDASKVGGVNALYDTYTGGTGGLVTVGDYNGHTKSDGAASVAIGVKARSDGDLSTAVGVRSSSLGDASSAFGMGSSAIENGSIALGAGSIANRAGGYAAYTGGATGNALGAINDTISRIELGAVSVGPGGTNGTRQIINVAAGSLDSDAVNVAQLKGVDGKVKKGLNFTGDDTTTVINRQLGETLTIKGGESNASKLASGNNIGVVADGSSTLTVKLAKDIDLGATGSVTMGSSSSLPSGSGPVTTVNSIGVLTGNWLGSTAVTGAGISLNGPLGIPSTTLTTNGLNIIGGPSVTRSGIDAGNKKVTRVFAGDVSATSTDAINGSQLHATNQSIIVVN